jgi:hypothetical protein
MLWLIIMAITAFTSNFITSLTNFNTLINNPISITFITLTTNPTSLPTFTYVNTSPSSAKIDDSTTIIKCAAISVTTRSSFQ